jgi:SAM-dependent methyltransferase
MEAPSSAKWNAYYSSSESPPWESGKEVSQISSAVEKGEFVGSIESVAEVGCGSGITSIYLSTRYARVEGIDISATALALAESRAAALSIPASKLRFLCADLLETPLQSHLRARYDVIFDCQTYHAIRTDANASLLAANYAGMMKEGAYLQIIAGCDKEVARVPGPTVLSYAQLVGPFKEAGLVVVRVHETRFDSTRAYGETPPLAWDALFRKAP